MTAVVVGLGPGPFTGLRVGLVTARTFAFARGIPVLGVCSLDALAHQAWRRGRRRAGSFVVATDARRKEVYWARYDVTDQGAVARHRARRWRPRPTWPRSSTARRSSGAGGLLYPEVLPGRVGPLDVSAGHLADLAARRLAAGADLSDVEPLYLRRPGRRADRRAPRRRCPVTLRADDVARHPGPAALEPELFGADAWSEASWWSELAQRPRRSYVVAERATGRSRATPVSTGPARSPTCMTIAVAPDRAGPGLGPAADGPPGGGRRDSGAEHLMLEVRADNAPAQRLYATHGFVDLDDETQVLPARATCDAHIMRLDLKDGAMTDDEPLVLGIETSCDETGVGIVRGEQLLVDAVASSVDEHARFGGVVPEVASRAHLEAMVPTIERACRDAGVRLADLDAVAVTAGPGLAGALLVGVAAAKALSVVARRPAVRREPPRRPRRGGHRRARPAAGADAGDAGLAAATPALLLVPDVTDDVRSLGSTIDDAAGEAFDKVARVLGLPFPGGPHVDRMAREGSSVAIDFPRGLTSRKDMERHRFDFSFSGLKTSVARWVEARERSGEPVPVADVAASFQEAVTDVLTRKAVLACREHGVERPAHRRRCRGQQPAAGDGAGAVRRGRHPAAGAPPGAVHRQRRDGGLARRRRWCPGAGRPPSSTSPPTPRCPSPPSAPEHTSMVSAAGNRS